MPGLAYYGSSKKYLRGFARALRSEMSVYGVNVTCVAPGGTATALYDGTAVPVERARRFGVMMEAGAVAEAALRGMFDGRGEVLPGALTKAMAAVAIVTPRWLVDLARRRAPWLTKAAGN